MKKISPIYFFPNMQSVVSSFPRLFVGGGQDYKVPEGKVYASTDPNEDVDKLAQALAADVNLPK